MESAVLTLRTAQLELRAASLALLEAELRGRSELTHALAAEVPGDWPPGEYDRPALEFFHAQCLALGAAAVGWYGWYVLHAPRGEPPPVLVGAGGYLGPPDATGVVEVGYSILPAWQGRGFARELVTALVARALATGRVRRLQAHTTPSNLASVRVLERTGFRLTGPGAEPGSIRYEYEATASAAV